MWLSSKPTVNMSLNVYFSLNNLKSDDNKELLE